MSKTETSEANNSARLAGKPSQTGKPVASTSPARSQILLSGGNPQIARGDGDAPVQAYIAAMPGWKQEVGHRLDAIVSRTVPGIVKAVKWNSPLYGIGGQGWIIGMHCLNRYVKVAFFGGASLKPLPPVASKTEETRYLHIFDDGKFDEDQFANWVLQASRLRGWGKV